MVSCCLCNGSRSWWNELKYCFLQCIRLHRITACSFFHTQRLGGNFITLYQKKGWLMVGRVALAMVFGPGGMDWNTVYCNASVFIVLLHAHFLTHNDWVETSFHFIVLVNGFLPALIHLSTCQTLLLQPMVAIISLFYLGDHCFLF